MKNLLFVLLLTPAALFAAPPDFSAITKALNAGDVATLAKFFDSANVEVTLPNDEGVYSKVQAAQIIKQFFADHKPKSFTHVHQGTNNNGLHYCIGKLVTDNGTFRVCYYLKESGGQYLIQEFSIEHGK